MYFFLTHQSHHISYFLLKDIPTIHKYHRYLVDLLYRSMDGVHLPKLTIWYLIVSSVTWGHHLYFCKQHPMCVPHLSFLPGIASLPASLFSTPVQLLTLPFASRQFYSCTLIDICIDKWNDFCNFGCLYWSGVVLESLFDLLGLQHLLTKLGPWGLTLSNQ